MLVTGNDETPLQAQSTPPSLYPSWRDDSNACSGGEDGGFGVDVVVTV